MNGLNVSFVILLKLIHDTQKLIKFKKTTSKKHSKTKQNKKQIIQTQAHKPVLQTQTFDSQTSKPPQLKPQAFNLHINMYSNHRVLIPRL